MAKAGSITITETRSPQPPLFNDVSAVLNHTHQELRAGSGCWSQDAAVVVVPAAALGRRISVLWPGGKVVQASLPAAGREISVDYLGTVRVIR